MLADVDDAASVQQSMARRRFDFLFPLTSSKEEETNNEPLDPSSSLARDGE
jgi:hypothetical protein